MMKKIMLPLLLSAFAAGCSSTSDTTSQVLPTNANNLLAKCDLPTVEDRGPIRPSLFVVGTFDEGQWIHLEDREMSHKGDGIYQVVHQEKAGMVNVQFATMNWNPQYTVSGREIGVDQEVALKRGGFAKNTRVDIPVDGKYVWSIQIGEDKTPVRAMIATCQ
ncbi:glycosidase [Vibrio aestuarianus]|uniref:Glycosidase n=1 Tax=Vibrio aestuarianus TaxID=28171 RepID=A0ABD7YQF6_9VIBR|nr:glycosidase [Vibrio aestuarianus]MDE1231154.1 glycosidase [Vibrio aestuarianus]MDE1337165.1 glycosidase [Vibrio aestuarianus]WGK87210.1 glycosidase [Vibrio aestuarianus]